MFFPITSRRRFGIIRAVGARTIRTKCEDQSVKIKGEYILLRRSIVRMITTTNDCPKGGL